MVKFETGYAGKTLQISVYAENIVRIRISDSFEPTFFEKYRIYKPAEETGILSENGVTTGKLTAKFEDGAIKFSSDKFSREIKLENSELSEIKGYMNERLNGFHDEKVVIIGSEDEEQLEAKTVDFQTDPKYITVKTEKDIFYGLGESNEDRLILNGKTYRERVVYQKYEIPIPFLMTPKGYGILANTSFWHGVDVCARRNDEIVWYLPQGDIDFLIFAGDDMRAILERFTYVTGRPALLPKWAYGLTFIECCQANQFDVMNDAEHFRNLGIPCSAISLEPGWTVRRYDFSTEKKWNKDRYYINEWQQSDKICNNFFSAALKRTGFRLHLWMCCQFDFTANEERLLGNEVAPEIPAFFDHLRQFCNDGADSFKVDPCRMVDTADEAKVYANGHGEPEMHSLLQTLLVKEMYHGARKHRGNIRPMHHYCGGYTGTNALTATNTGDTGGGLNTLSWILNCGLSGISNITCDMNIFKTNAIHYAFFTGWCQLNSWSGFEHPWWAGKEHCEIFKFYDIMRYALMPYIYSNAIEANMTGTPMCRALPLMFDDELCKNLITEYMFGDSLLVGAFSDKIYLPQGSVWYDAWTGNEYEGGEEVPVVYPEDRAGALFIRGGAIIPTEKPKQFEDDKNTENIILNLYPYGKSEYTMFEDDGITFDYEKNRRASTRFEMNDNGSECELVIGERCGEFNGMTEKRTYSAKVRLTASPKTVTVDGNAVEFSYSDGFVSFEIGTGKNVKIVY